MSFISYGVCVCVIFPLIFSVWPQGATLGFETVEEDFSFFF